jgi:hypothetical protein
LRALAASLALATAVGCRPEAIGPVEEERPPLEIAFLGDLDIEAGVEGDSLAFGGVSALSHSPDTGHWLAFSDARVFARFFEIEVSFEDGSPLKVAPLAVFHLVDGQGNGFAEDVIDAEGAARMPWGDLLVSSEPDTREEPVEQAKLLEFDEKGRLLRSFELPEKFLISGSPPASGLRHNLAFEGLAVSPDASRVFLGTEATLMQDGPPASFDTAGFSRIIMYRVEGRDLTAQAEYAYSLGPFGREPDYGEQEVSGGLVDLVALSNTRLLALERIFIRERSGEKRDVTRARIYDVDLKAASDVSAIQSLASPSRGADWRPARKELFLDLDDVVPRLSATYRKLDNLEAMALGPNLPGGGRALLIASDDNFHETQRTQFLLFRLNGI